MKTTYAFILVVVLVVLGVVLWNKDKVEEGVDTSGNTTTNNSTSNNSGSNLPPGSVPVVPSEAKLDGSTFRMTTYNGVAVPTDSKYTIAFKETTLTAKFCNSMSGSFILDKMSIKASNLVSTKMACATPANLMKIESDFTSMLNFGATIYQSGGQVIVSSASKDTVMVFVGF